MRTLMVCGSFVLATTVLAGCLKTTAFNCADNGACGVGGICEPERVCSIADGDCASGRRFDSSAGSYAGTCVGGDPGVDGGVDTAVDQAIDTPTTGCRPDFASMTNGNTGHKYKLINTPGSWLGQQTTTCVGQSSYLAIPDTVPELQALFDLAGQNPIWVGVNDIAVEGTFVDVLGLPYNVAGITITGNKVPDDCAQTPNGTTLDIKPCGDNHIAVCECDD